MNPNTIKQLKDLFGKESEIGQLGIPDSAANRYYEESKSDKNDIRSPFFRDTDRIIHSKAYARYIGKSQVFFNLDTFNANITHRSLHVTLVSRLGQQIGRVLKLNTDLIKAIAHGHDVGHPPFGHLGEQILNELSDKHNLGRFFHNAQGVRWLSRLERRFPQKPARGLNLTLQVLDGILCHNGEISERKLKPNKINGKTWDDHFREYKDSMGRNELDRIPMSYEGIAVRFADTMAYIGRDIEDAILLNYIKREDIPKNCQEVLGNTNRDIIRTLMMDLLSHSLKSVSIGYSERIFKALKQLKKFNYNEIYHRRDFFMENDSNMTFMDKIREKFNIIFEKSLHDLREERFNAPIFKDHIEYIDNNNYSTYYKPLRKDGKLPLIVRDYISGMSDEYFRIIYKRIKTQF
ncbi:MAG: HD domain-containing protein [Promethearchaeota archaeon]|nr:MAG: HD domain-containing protein [Candidatus Lokiarchaeota archaeon]